MQNVQGNQQLAFQWSYLYFQLHHYHHIQDSTLLFLSFDQSSNKANPHSPLVLIYKKLQKVIRHFAMHYNIGAKYLQVHLGHDPHNTMNYLVCSRSLPPSFLNLLPLLRHQQFGIDLIYFHQTSIRLHLNLKLGRVSFPENQVIYFLLDKHQKERQKEQKYDPYHQRLMVFHHVLFCDHYQSQYIQVPPWEPLT